MIPGVAPSRSRKPKYGKICDGRDSGTLLADTCRVAKARCGLNRLFALDGDAAHQATFLVAEVSSRMKRTTIVP